MSRPPSARIGAKARGILAHTKGRSRAWARTGQVLARWRTQAVNAVSLIQFRMPLNACAGGTMAEGEGESRSIDVNPYLLPPDQHGWRGIGLEPHHKRKWYTLLHNETVLVTALLLIPGEHSIRHSHETGELSIHYDGTMKPGITWHPPGVIHSGPRPTTPDEAVRQARENAMLRTADDSPFAELLHQLIRDNRDMRAKLEAISQSQIGPRIIVDVLFPPFRTTIDDPAYGDVKVVTGQWYD